MNTPCLCRFCKGGDPHPATPEHGSYEPAGRAGFRCKKCGHLIPAEEVTPA